MEHRINADREFFGFKMRTRRHYHDDHIIKSCLDESKNLYKMPVNPKIVVDIGANIGCVSLIAAKRGARVFAFEPASDNFETFKHNVEINDFKDRIDCINLGVGKSGKTKLYIHPRNSGATSAFLAQNGSDENLFEIVDFISIYDVFNIYKIQHCDFLKMDCEGSEKDIIEDLDDNLASKINQISLEFHDKKLIEYQVKKLSRWFIPEQLRRYEWTFRKI